MNNKEQSDEEFLRQVVIIGQTSKNPVVRKERLASMMITEEPIHQAPRLVKERARLVECENPNCHRSLLRLRRCVGT